MPLATLQTPTLPTVETEVERPLGQALRRGWMCRCPACGAGPMLKSYLKVRDRCPVCNEALYHQRADDGPAYMTILVVGHVMAPSILWVYTSFRPDPLVMASVFSVGTVALSLFLLPRLKGMMVALQWSRRMHGFGGPVADAPLGND
jgi:uncharacterized protein (DUF983 family)